MNPSEDPLRRLAAERGRILGELGVRADDARWSRLDAETIASLITVSFPLRLPRLLRRWIADLLR